MSLHVIRYALKAALRDKMVWGLSPFLSSGPACRFFLGFGRCNRTRSVRGRLYGWRSENSGVNRSILVRRLFCTAFLRFPRYRVLADPSGFCAALLFLSPLSAAFSTLAFVCGAFLALILSLLSMHYGEQDGIVLWSIGVTFELMIVCNVAFFLCHGFVISGYGWPWCSRVLCALAPDGRVVVDCASSGDGDERRHETCYRCERRRFPDYPPRFDLMAQTSWLIYGGPRLWDWVFVVVQAAIFLTLVISATIIDLRRKQF